MAIPEATIDKVLLIIASYLQELTDSERSLLSSAVLSECPYGKYLGPYFESSPSTVVDRLTTQQKLWLLERLPSLLASPIKYKAVEVIWRCFAPKSSTVIVFGKDADFAVFWEKFRAKAKSLPGSYRIPKEITNQFPWLCSADAIIEQARLNGVRVERAQNTFAGIKRTIWLGMEQLAVRDRNKRRLTHSVKIDEHEFLLVFDRQFNGIIFDPPPESLVTLQPNAEFGACSVARRRDLRYIMGSESDRSTIRFGCAPGGVVPRRTDRGSGHAARDAGT